MSAFADLSEWVNRQTGGNNGNPQALHPTKIPRIAGAAAPATIAGRWHSLWLYEGSPSHGATPGAVAVPDNTTQGGVKQVDPSGGRDLWATGFFAGASVPGVIEIYDRLLHIGGLVSNVTNNSQAVGGSITRNVGGIGNEIWVEIYGIIGTSVSTAWATYVNQAGVGGQVTPVVAFGGTGNREVSRIFRLPLAAGDTGVQSVTTFHNGATTNTAGNVGVTIARPLARVPIVGAGMGDWDALLRSGRAGVKIDSGACLAYAMLMNSTGAPEINTSLYLAER